MPQRQLEIACRILFSGKCSPLHLPLAGSSLCSWNQLMASLVWIFWPLLHHLSVYFDCSVFISGYNPRYLTVIYEIDLVQSYTAENLFRQFLQLLCLPEWGIKCRVQHQLSSFVDNFAYDSFVYGNLQGHSDYDSTWIVKPRFRIPFFKRSRKASRPFLDMKLNRCISRSISK